MLLPLQAGCSKLALKAKPFLLHYKLLKRAAKKTQALMRGDASRVGIIKKKDTSYTK
jgi:hypothetical protein